jgi:serine protease DegQ
MTAVRPDHTAWARRFPTLSLALAAALAAALAGCTFGQEPARSAPAPVTAARVSSGAQASGAGDIPGIVRKVEPSVVTIFTGGGLGSGVVWAADGTIVTNHHVIAPAVQGGGNGEVEVGFADGRRVAGKVRASDPITDLAVVQAERKDLPPATFQKALPVVGELAVAIGSPLGLENTVTAGIISGLQREIPGADQQALVDLLQTDAAISPGNSGGALVNGRGEIIGINEAYLPPETGAVSLGFAIPSTTVVDIVDQLLRTGRARHAFVGVGPAPITPEIAAQLGIDRANGVLVQEVVPGGPAADAGIQPGDVLIRMGDRELEGVEDFLDEVRARKPGDKVGVTVLRGGQERQVEVTLVDRPPG